jgi:hypothetical protein
LSAINEAYARIDVAMIQDLVNRIASLEKRMPDGPVAKIRNEDKNIQGIKIFARAVNVSSNSSDSIKVEFGSGTFSGNPIVTATAYDPTSASGETESPTLVMKDISKTSVTIDIKRKTKGRLIIHVIAIGDS